MQTLDPATEFPQIASKLSVGGRVTLRIAFLILFLSLFVPNILLAEHTASPITATQLDMAKKTIGMEEVAQLQANAQANSCSTDIALIQSDPALLDYSLTPILDVGNEKYDAWEKVAPKLFLGMQKIKILSDGGAFRGKYVGTVLSGQQTQSLGYAGYPDMMVPGIVLGVDDSLETLKKAISEIPSTRQIMEDMAQIRTAMNEFTAESELVVGVELLESSQPPLSKETILNTLKKLRIAATDPAVRAKKSLVGAMILWRTIHESPSGGSASFATVGELEDVLWDAKSIRVTPAMSVDEIKRAFLSEKDVNPESEAAIEKSRKFVAGRARKRLQVPPPSPEYTEWKLDFDARICDVQKALGRSVSWLGLNSIALERNYRVIHEISKNASSVKPEVKSIHMRDGKSAPGESPVQLLEGHLIIFEDADEVQIRRLMTK